MLWTISDWICAGLGFFFVGFGIGAAANGDWHFAILSWLVAACFISVLPLKKEVK